MSDASNYVWDPILLQQFGAVLYFFWRYEWLFDRLQCIVIVWSFLRLLKLHKLAVGKLDLWRGVSRCVRPWIKFTPEYPFNTGNAAPKVISQALKMKTSKWYSSRLYRCLQMSASHLQNVPAVSLRCVFNINFIDLMIGYSSIQSVWGKIWDSELWKSVTVCDTYINVHYSTHSFIQIRHSSHSFYN